MRNIRWIRLSNALPAEGESVWLKNKSTVWHGRRRFGMQGEPQPDELGWRADCCGRFCNPTHWMPATTQPNNLTPKR